MATSRRKRSLLERVTTQPPTPPDVIRFEPEELNQLQLIQALITSKQMEIESLQINLVMKVEAMTDVNTSTGEWHLDLVNGTLTKGTNNAIPTGKQ